METIDRPIGNLQGCRLGWGGGGESVCTGAKNDDIGSERGIIVEGCHNLGRILFGAQNYDTQGIIVARVWYWNSLLNTCLLLLLGGRHRDAAQPHPHYRLSWPRPESQITPLTIHSHSLMKDSRLIIYIYIYNIYINNN